MCSFTSKVVQIKSSDQPITEAVILKSLVHTISYRTQHWQPVQIQNFAQYEIRYIAIGFIQVGSGILYTICPFGPPLMI